MQYRFIAIEGNIGAGKTTLATLLQKHFNARLILEEFADNPFLPKFYENPQQYAFPLELFFMAERYKQLKELTPSNDLFNQITVSDYLFTKCLLFAKVNLSSEEYRLCLRLFDIMQQQLLQPDLLIYLHSPVEKLQENIRNRNRIYEQQIKDSYLENIQQNYMQFIKHNPAKTIVVDAGNADFTNKPEHLQIIIDALNKDDEAVNNPVLLP